MNIAFPAVFFLILAFPGLIAVRAYLLGSKDSPSARTSVPEQFVLALPSAAVFHVLWVAFAAYSSHQFGTPPVDAEIVLALLASTAERDDIRQAVAHKNWIAVYFFTLYAASFLGGRLLHYSIRSRKLDHRFSWLRFDTPWHYLFTGERTLFSEAISSRTETTAPQGIEPDAIETLVQVTVEHSGNTYIYDGWLSNFEINSQGGLDRIELAFARRRMLCRNTTSGHYDIDGCYFVIDYQDVQDMNVDYLWYEEVTEETVAVPAPVPGADGDA